VRRLARYVLAEVAIVASALVGVGVASQRVVTVVAEGWQARADRLRALGTLPPRGEISDPPDPAITDDVAGTFLGMSDELLLDRVRRQEIVKVKVNHGGTSLSFRVEFADGSRAAFKPAQTNLQTIPRKEVAAYRLNRLLGLNAVPPAAPRLVSRDELMSRLPADAPLPRIRAETLFNPLGKTAGVVMYWVPELRDSGFDTPLGKQQWTEWLTLGSAIPQGREGIAVQLSNLVVFDFLTSNPDRYSGGNMKMSPDGSRLYFMDNTMAFFLDPTGNEKTRPVLLATQRFSRHLYRALDKVSLGTLQQVLSQGNDSPFEILTPSEMRAVVARRDVIKRHVEGLVAAHGESAVLAFP
jgi:hypothetical protein